MQVFKTLAASVFASLSATAAAAQQAGWGNVGQQQEETMTWAKWWTQPLWGGTWMAWTAATLSVFIFIFGAMIVLVALEFRYPGGQERRGILNLVTTRGDRLFLSLLGSVYIFLAWLGFFGMPLWAPLALSIGWGAFCFWKV